MENSLSRFVRWFQRKNPLTAQLLVERYRLYLDLYRSLKVRDGSMRLATQVANKRQAYEKIRRQNLLYELHRRLDRS